MFNRFCKRLIQVLFFQWASHPRFFTKCDFLSLSVTKLIIDSYIFTCWKWIVDVTFIRALGRRKIKTLSFKNQCQRCRSALCGSWHYSSRWGQQGAGSRVLSSVSQQPQVRAHSCSPPSRREELMVCSQGDTRQCTGKGFLFEVVTQGCRAVPPCPALVPLFLTSRGEWKWKSRALLTARREETHCTYLKITFCCKGVFSRFFKQFSCF